MNYVTAPPESNLVEPFIRYSCLISEPLYWRQYSTNAKYSNFFGSASLPPPFIPLFPLFLPFHSSLHSSPYLSPFPPPTVLTRERHPWQYIVQREIERERERVRERPPYPPTWSVPIVQTNQIIRDTRPYAPHGAMHITFASHCSRPPNGNWGFFSTFESET